MPSEGPITRIRSKTSAQEQVNPPRTTHTLDTTTTQIHRQHDNDNNGSRYLKRDAFEVFFRSKSKQSQTQQSKRMKKKTQKKPKPRHLMNKQRAHDAREHWYYNNNATTWTPPTTTTTTLPTKTIVVLEKTTLHKYQVPHQLPQWIMNMTLTNHTNSKYLSTTLFWFYTHQHSSVHSS